MRFTDWRIAACICLAWVTLPGTTVTAGADRVPPRVTDRMIKRPLTVAEAVETTRAFSTYSNVTQSADGAVTRQRQDVFVSPDGKRYAAVLVRGDLGRNGNWLELIAGSLESLEAAKRYEKVASLFLLSKGTRHDDGSAYITHASWNRIQWLPDSKRVAFLYGPDESPVQVFAVNVETKQVEPLTQAPRGVLGYEIDARGALIYTSLAAHCNTQSIELLRNGFAVADTSSLIDVLRGEVDGYTSLDWTSNVERYLSTPQHPLARKIVVNPEGRDRFWSLFETQFSPDGRYALIDGTPGEVPAEWDRYTQPFFKLLVHASRQEGMRFVARQMKALYLVDLADLSVKPLWDAPKSSSSQQAAWSADSRSILLGPTFLPVERAEAAGLEGTALAVIDVATGQYRQLPVPQGTASQGFAHLRWRSGEEVEITNGSGETLRFQKRAGQWSLAEKSRALGKATHDRRTIRVELRQDMNTPPALYAVEQATGRSALILDLNPKLREEVLLGRVEHYTWTDKERRTWSGLLYYPVDYTKGRRYPLVIQTHGHAALDEFSLYGRGEGLGPSGLPYAAQSLAGRGMAVLQIEDKNIPGIDSTPGEAELYKMAYETAVGSLVQSGLVYHSKVGLSGFSRTGFHVKYALAHSEFPYAAALASDNFDGGYLQSLIFEGTGGDRVNGAKPFGEGLKNWMRTAVGFNVEQMQTPLRLEVQSYGLAGVLTGWEVFTRLRRLGRPVEYYVIPDIEHGVHGVQNPRQCLGSQEGAVDWFDFWLNGHEDTTAGKADQYARWRKLRMRRDAAL